MSADVRQVGSLAEALAAYDDRFLRWQVTSAGFQAAWVGQRAVVIHRLRGTQPQLIVLGHGPQVTEPLELAAAVLPSQQLADGSVRLTVESRAAPYLPASLRLAAEKTDAWEWMWTRAEPPPVPGEEAVRWTDDMDPVLTLLAHANPRHHGRPGDPDIRGWAGVYEAGSLVCAGALADLDTGAAHLRSITTAPQSRGRGLGAAVSAFLARAALRSHPPAVTLGLYSDNATARRLYTRLGFQPSHALLSGPLVRHD